MLTPWLLAGLLCASPELRFVREHVELTVIDGGFEVTGDYVFTRGGTGSRAVAIDYPFSFAGEGTIEVLEPRNHASSPARFLLRFEGEAHEATMRVRYRHTLPSRRAGYIVTSALSWGVPLERAEFVLHAPARWGTPTSSWPLAEPVCAGARCDWQWTFEPFHPAANLTLSWSSP